MNRKAIAAVVFGLILGLSIPSIADHVNEPSAPILDIPRLDVYQYPDGENVPCDLDGTNVGNVAIGSNIRIEPFIVVQNAPSEHWTTDIRVWEGPWGANPEWPNPRTGKRVNRMFSSWDTKWRHQNVGPHLSGSSGFHGATTTGWEFIQANTYTSHSGAIAIEVVARGDQSGNVLTARCVFNR